MLRWWDGEQWTDHRTDDPAGPTQRAHATPAATGPKKTSGWAIASLVFGIFGGVLFAIIFGVIAKDRIRRSGGRLTGEGLANAGIVLGSIWAVVAITAFVVSEIETTDNSEKYTGSEAAIAEVVDRMEHAFADDTGDEACDELLTVRFASAVARGSGRSCADFVDEAVEDGQFQADIRIKKMTVTGETATVDVTEGGDPQTWRMRREAGTWRIDGITEKP